MNTALFLLSLIFIFFSSFLFTSVVMKKINKSDLGFIFFNLFAFSQIILTFEILSLFGIICRKNFLILNLIFLTVSIILWIFNNFPVYRPNIKREIQKIKNALKKDKLLSFTAICFVIFILCTLLSAVFLPVTFGDALVYYLTRCTSWIQNGSINHFITPDAREIIMPVNMELLYTYILMFRKSENGTAIFSYISFINLLYIIYNFLGSMGFSVRKKLWSVFSVSSFCLIGLMAYVPCAEIASGTLLLASIYLVFCYLKEEKLIILFFASLSAAISFGVKTTSLIAFPSVIFLITVMIYLFKKEKLRKILFIYSLMLFCNFIIFSSYNYVLNYIQFGNPIASNQFIYNNSFTTGIKEFFYNITKNILMFFDASGLGNFNKYNDFMNKISTSINFGTSTKLFPSNYIFSSKIIMAYSGLGILGLLLFLPSIFISLFKLLNFKQIKSPVTILLSCFGLAFVFNFLLFSLLMVYTAYNMRYFITFICISSICLVFTYIKSSKNIIKWILCYFMFIYLAVIGHKPFCSFLYKYVYLKIKYPEIQSPYKFINYIAHNNEETMISEYIKSKKINNIGFIAYAQGYNLYDIEKLKLDGYKTEKLIIPNINNHDINKYDYLITNVYKIDSYTDAKKTDFNSNPPFNCKYITRDLKETDDFKQSFTTVCDIPFEYFINSGFEKVNDLNLNKYYLWKNKNPH